jgi:hypothetical protein
VSGRFLDRHRVQAGGVAQEGLTVPPACLNFGEVWEDRHFVWTLPVENRSHEDIQVLEFTSSCKCLGIEPPVLVVPAGQTAEIRLTLDLTDSPHPDTNGGSPEGSGFSHRQGTNATVRDFRLAIAYRAAGMPNPRPWILQGRVRSALALVPPLLYLGDDLVKGQPFEPQTVVVTAHTPLAELTAKCDPALASVHVTPLEGDRNRYAIELALNRTIRAGSFNFNVSVQAVTADGVQPPSLTLPVEGRVEEDVRAVPPRGRIWDPDGGASVPGNPHPSVVERESNRSGCR